MMDVIIPARNEEKTIGPIVRAFKNCHRIRRVIVVSNMSQDRTMQRAWRSGADEVIKFDMVRGKGQAIQKGLESVTTEKVILCDGDLNRFRTIHAELLSIPVNNGMIIGVPEFTRNVPWAVPGVVWDLVSGQRQVPSSLARSLPLHGYCCEVQLNEAAHREGISICRLKLPGVYGTPKPTPQRLEEMRIDGEWLKAHYPQRNRSGLRNIWPKR